MSDADRRQREAASRRAAARISDGDCLGCGRLVHRGRSRSQACESDDFDRTDAERLRSAGFFALADLAESGTLVTLCGECSPLR